jgi:predicted GNAT family N-acyltransferase
MSLSIELLDWERARELARPIRYEVFVVEQGVPVALEWDEFDAVSLHALARDAAGKAVGTGRLLPDGHVGRMAVAAAARGRGVGAAILERLIDEARRRGLPRLVLHSQARAEGFYRRFGFVAEGGEYLEAGIPHVTMSLDLAARGAD